jgi:hypothetical protein
MTRRDLFHVATAAATTSVVGTDPACATTQQVAQHLEAQIQRAVAQFRPVERRITEADALAMVDATWNDPTRRDRALAAMQVLRDIEARP